MPTDSEFNLNAEFIAEATAGRVLQGHGIEVTRGAEVDSRRILPGQIFVPLQGKNTDGHNFIEAALEKGATGVFIAKERVDEFKDVVSRYRHRAFVVVVTAPLAALQDLAATWLGLLRTLVIGITGSVGKTSTKGILATGLKEFGLVTATPGNYNNAIGLPLSVLRITPADKWAVLEYGTSGFGEIDFLTGIARPDVAVVTGVSGSHLENLKDLDGVARAKAELARALPKGGTAVLNADDPRTRKMAEYADNTVLFGKADDADIRVISVKVTNRLTTACTLSINGIDMDIELNVLGLHHAYNLAAAVGAAKATGLNPYDFARACMSFRGEPMRMEVMRTPDGIVVNDSYNASLTSIRAAVDTLSEIEMPVTVVLGDVLESGSDSIDLHKEIGRIVAKSNAKLFITIGEQMSFAADAAVDAGMDKNMVHKAIDHKQAAEMVMSLSEDKPVVLVKGSRGMKMELVARTLTSIWNTEPETRMEQ